MKIYYDRDKKHFEAKAKTVRELLAKLKINPDTVIISVNKELVTEDYKIEEKDDIKILSVVSGG
tara:strand:+ start:4896 stop:5087 length:192 start_codon:yes stop_codon:yes gene_type:complete